MDEKTALADFLTEYLAEHLPEVYCVETIWKKGRNPMIEILVDAHAGIQLEQCAELNRSLRPILEEKGWINDDYELEVGSPGVGRPLKLKRQYVKNIGRTVSVLKTNGERAEGQLTAVDDENLTLTIQKKMNKNSKKKEPIETKIEWSAIKETTVVVTF